MVPRNSIELQVGYINRLHFIFEAHVFITWLLSRFEKVGFILFFGVFFPRFIFFETSFLRVLFLLLLLLVVVVLILSLWRMIFHSPSKSLINSVCVRASSSTSSWNVCFRHTKTSTHGEHKHAHIQSHSQSHSHISTRSHLHHCECARAVLIEAKIRF